MDSDLECIFYRHSDVSYYSKNTRFSCMCVSVSMQSWYRNVVDDICKRLHGWMLGMYVLENVDKNVCVGRIRSVDCNVKHLQSPSWTTDRTLS